MHSRPTDHEFAQVRATLAGNVRVCRAVAGLTQEELAGKAGVATRHLQKIESGQVNVTLRTLVRLAAALGVMCSTLLKDGGGGRP